MGICVQIVKGAMEAVKSFREKDQTVKRKGSRSGPRGIDLNVLPSSSTLYFHTLLGSRSIFHSLLEVTTSLKMRSKLGSAPQKIICLICSSCIISGSPTPLRLSLDLSVTHSP